MKLKESFVTYAADGQHTMVATEGFSGIVRSNGTAAFIIEALKSPTTIEAIVAAMAKKYDAPQETIAADVVEIIAKLRSIGAIEEGD